MTALRKSAIEELEKVPEDKLAVIIQFIHKVTEEGAVRKKVWDLEQFVMAPTERGQDADAYVRELRDNDRLWKSLYWYFTIDLLSRTQFVIYG